MYTYNMYIYIYIYTYIMGFSIINQPALGDFSMIFSDPRLGQEGHQCHAPQGGSFLGCRRGWGEVMGSMGYYDPSMGYSTNLGYSTIMGCSKNLACHFCVCPSHERWGILSGS